MKNFVKNQRAEGEWIGLIILVIVIILFVFTSSNNPLERENLIENNYTHEHKYIKEMSSEVGISGKISGEFLLIAGSVYGQIDTQHSITLIYKVTIDNEDIYKTISLPLESVDIVTIGKNDKPYFIITKGYRNLERIEDIYTTYDIRRIKLYLPDGWQILNER